VINRIEFLENIAALQLDVYENKTNTIIVEKEMLCLARTGGPN